MKSPSGKTSVKRSKKLLYRLPESVLDREPSYDEKGRIRDFRRKNRSILDKPAEEPERVFRGPIESDR